MPKPRFLRVFPNPYHFLDHEGRPHATFDADPVQHNPNAKKIGVKSMSATVLVKRDPKVDDRGDIHDVVCQYSDEVQVLPDGHGEHGPSLHARMGLRQGADVIETKDERGAVISRKIRIPGALVAADEATAKAVGLPFADPIELLAAARADAIERYTADYGEPPAFATDDDLEAHVPPLLRGIKPATESEAKKVETIQVPALTTTTDVAYADESGGK